jgi:very-short-patch-repair endonuclease
VVNTRVGEMEVDFTWPRYGVAVETDGRRHHDTPFAFERDRRRDAALTLAGWRVARFSWRQVVDEPAVVADVVRTLLVGGEDAHLRRSAA